MKKRPGLVFPFLMIIALGASLIAIGTFLPEMYEREYWLRYSRERRESMSELNYKIFMSIAEEVSLEKFIELFGNETLIPTWMPDGIELRRIYVVLGNQTIHAILVCSDRDVEDYRKDNITIQITKPSFAPSVQSLKQDKSYNDGNYTNGELVNISDKWTIIYDKRSGIPITIEFEDGRRIELVDPQEEPAVAYFWHKDTYYFLSSCFAKDVLIKIIENMKPCNQTVKAI